MWKISGNIHDPNDFVIVEIETVPNDLIVIQLFDIYENLVQEQNIISDDDGLILDASFRIPSDAEPGLWTIRAMNDSNYDAVEIEVHNDLFLLEKSGICEDPRSFIPLVNWVGNLFIWHSEGKISEKTFCDSIQYLDDLHVCLIKKHVRFS